MPDTTLGQRLRLARRAAKKTLQAVADQAGVSAGFLSQAERDLTGVSLSSLAGIARALGVPVSSLFEAPELARPDTHEGQRPRYAVDAGAALVPAYERLSSQFPGSQINAVKMSLPPGYVSETVSHEGDELVYVLSGTVEYEVGGERFPLGAGDSLHFDGGKRHCLRNAGELPAEVISVGTLALFDSGKA
ncbi:MAG: cupin domain-containing protein [Gammaproteobacteria bacterium]|nr:cupin domain-containing protein [Gammaproteobacteria bacterium]